MTAMIWKDFRACARWALLCGLALASATAMALVAGRDVLTRSPLEVPLTALPMSMVTTWGFALAGMALGLAQMQPDRSPARWALLVHTPMPRWSIFTSRIVAGLGLYVLAAGLPLAAATGWSATPGTAAAPFDWYFVLPRLADLLGGTSYYFAAILATRLESKWHGGRILAMGAALAGTGLTLHLGEFWHAALAASLTSACLGYAAWWKFRSEGGFARLPWPGKLTHLLTATLGLAGLLVTLPLLATSLLPYHDSKHTWREYKVDYEGQIVAVTYRGPGYASKPTAIEALSGSPLPLAHTVSARFVPLPRRIYVPNYRSARRVLVAVTSWSYDPPMVHYYHRRKGLFVSYNPETRQQIGWLSPGGFSSARLPPPERFREPPGGATPRGVGTTGSAVFADGLYVMDFESQTIEHHLAAM